MYLGLRVYFLDKEFLPKLNNSRQIYFSINLYDVKEENIEQQLCKGILKKQNKTNSQLT